MRANLREAVRLFKEAGYELRGGQMVNAKTGEPLTVEFLEFQNVFERVILPYAPPSSSSSASRAACGHRSGAVPEPDPRLRLRRHHGVLARIPVARQ